MKSPNPSAPPFPVANPAQARRPRRKDSLYSAPCLRGPPKSATGKGFGERIARFMNSPGSSASFAHVSCRKVHIDVCGYVCGDERGSYVATL